MRSSLRYHLLRGALVAFLALDLLGLVALLYDQLFSVETPYLWVMSGVMVLAALPMLTKLADYLLAPPGEGGIGTFSGGKIP
jgi:hypothetical protein